MLFFMTVDEENIENVFLKIHSVKLFIKQLNVKSRKRRSGYSRIKF